MQQRYRPGEDYYLGVDVQLSRGCSYYVLDARLDYISSGWLVGEDPDEFCEKLLSLVDSLSARDPGRIAVGIDAPRVALSEPRQYYFRSGKWINKTPQNKGYGRHCEVVIKALNIANPQWTPLEGEAPAWMELGFALFNSLRDYPYIYEVFPTASYRLLEKNPGPQIKLSFENFLPGPKDMLDAAVSAFTAAQVRAGKGCEVGGGDGKGTIALPAGLPICGSHPVLKWPENSDSGIRSE